MSNDRWSGAHAAQGRPAERYSQADRATDRSNETLAQSAATQRAPDSYPAPGATPHRIGGPPVNSSQGDSTQTAAAGATAAEAASKAIPSDFPPVVYLPCAEAVVDPSDARIEMRETQDGRTALLAYSALDRLHYCCGDDQAWIVMPTAGLNQLQKAHPFQLLMLDVEIPVEQRRGKK